MEQLTETNKLYRKTHTEDKYENEVKASFIISIDKTHGHDQQVDKEFEHDTTYEGVEAHGGRMAPDDQCASWAQSVQELESPACLDWSAVEMPDVLLPPWSPEGLVLAAKVPALRAGLAAWFARPGCTDIMASNYNATALTNDTSCVFEPCNEMIQACFDRCEKKYHSKISKDQSDAYYCAKGCADMHGGKVRNHYEYCPGVSNTTRFDTCMGECEGASSSDDAIKHCQYGCGYWVNSTLPNSTELSIAV